MDIKISVIIPVYKPDMLFVRCLNSLKEQTFLDDDFEIILVLNGDRNPYEKFVYDNIKSMGIHNYQFLYCKNKGVSPARNLGITQAKGKYITFIDSDDWISPSYIEILYDTTITTQLLPLPFCLDYNENKESYEINFVGNNYKRLIGKKYINHLAARSYFSVPWGKLLKRELFQSFMFDEEFDYGEDALYMFSIEPLLPPCLIVDKNATYYRSITENSLSHKKRSRKEILIIHFKLLTKYTSLYLKNIRKYSFIFYLNRLLAVCSHIITGK